MLMDLGKDVYAEDFEAPFLARSAEYYRQALDSLSDGSLLLSQQACTVRTASLRR